MIIDFNSFIKEHEFQTLAQKQRDIIPTIRNLKAKAYLKARALEYQMNLNEYHDEIEFPMLSDLLNEWKTLRTINGAFKNKWEDLQDICHSVLIKKASEYAQAEKRLHNFMECQDIYGGSLSKQVIDLRKKHLISIFDILDNQNKEHSIEFLDEKFGDYVNYTLLLFYASSYEQEYLIEQTQ